MYASTRTHVLLLILYNVLLFVVFNRCCILSGERLCYVTCVIEIVVSEARWSYKDTFHRWSQTALPESCFL